MSGRSDRNATLTARQRRPNLGHYYRRRIGDLHPDDFRWRIGLYRPGAPKRNRSLQLGKACTQFEIRLETAQIQGTLTLQRQDPDKGDEIPIDRGDRVRILLYHHKRWHRLWDLTVTGVPEVTLGEGTMSVELGDPLAKLEQDERKWEFKKDDSHPHGWRPGEIATHVCHKQGVPIGRIVNGHHRIDNLKMKSAGLAVIKKAFAEERDDTGQRFVIRFRNGRLDVVPIRRNRVLYEIHHIEEDASVSGQPPGKSPTTVVEAHARVNKKKVTVKVVAHRAAARFGRQTKEVHYGRMGSRKAVRNKALRFLAREIEPKRTANLTIPCIPFIERGDAVRWRTKEPGWHGSTPLAVNRQFAFTTSVIHNVGADFATTSLVLTQRDPYLKQLKEIAQAEQDDKDKKRKGQNDNTGGTSPP